MSAICADDDDASYVEDIMCTDKLVSYCKLGEVPEEIARGTMVIGFYDPKTGESDGHHDHADRRDGVILVVASAMEADEIPLLTRIASRYDYSGTYPFIGNFCRQWGWRGARDKASPWRAFSALDARNVIMHVKLTACERVIFACPDGQTRSRTVATLVSSYFGFRMEKPPGITNFWFAKKMLNALRDVGQVPIFH